MIYFFIILLIVVFTAIFITESKDKQWISIPLALILIFMVLGIFELKTIETKTRIQPDLKIIIENGEADTTFIYRRN